MRAFALTFAALALVAATGGTHAAGGTGPAVMAQGNAAGAPAASAAGNTAGSRAAAGAGPQGPGPKGPGPQGPGPKGPGPMGPGPMGAGPMGAGPMGPGMMGHGMMGPGLMGYGSMGPGMMMGVPGAMMGLERLDLSAEQRTRIAQIQDEAREQHQVLMELMHGPDGPMTGMMGIQGFDDDAARTAYESMSTLHKAMFESHLETRRRILDVLTPGQREQLARSWR